VETRNRTLLLLRSRLRDFGLPPGNSVPNSLIVFAERRVIPQAFADPRPPFILRSVKSLPSAANSPASANA
jgi:hypothetical protein